MSDKLFYLLQVNDALFPIGGYSHSQGLETYIQKGIVHDETSAKEYIINKLKWSLANTDLLAVRMAFEAARDGNLQGISKLVEGMEVTEVIQKIEGIHCGFKPTSCPDQLAKALKQILGE